MNMKLSSLALILFSAFLSHAAHAEVKFNGFASIRGGLMFDETADQGSIPYNDTVSFKDESLFALQGKADLSDGLSATIQLLAEGSNDFQVEAHWAYLSYQLNDTHTIHAGRLVNPLYYQAEFEKVKYAQNTRLPQTVYQPIDFNTIEGIALDSLYSLNDYTLRTKVIYGNWAGVALINSTNSFETLEISELAGINAELSSNWWNVFAGGWVAKINFPIMDSAILPSIGDSILSGFSAEDNPNGLTILDDNGNIVQTPAVQEFLDAVSWSGKDTFYAYTGFGIDYNNILINAEYSRAGVWDATDAIDESWYLQLGYRFEEWVVTLTTEDYSQASHQGYLSSVSDPTLKSLGSIISNAFGERAFDGEMVSLRYDFHPSAAMKLDYFNGSSNSGSFSGISFGIDLVF